MTPDVTTILASLIDHRPPVSPKERLLASAGLQALADAADLLRARRLNWRLTEDAASVQS